MVISIFPFWFGGTLLTLIFILPSVGAILDIVLTTFVNVTLPLTGAIPYTLFTKPDHCISPFVFGGTPSIVLTTFVNTTLPLSSGAMV